MQKTKKVLKFIGAALLAIFIVLIIFLGYLTICEYRPEPFEDVDGFFDMGDALSTKEPVTILSYNTGYAGLGQQEDFFMDGGTKVMPDSKAIVEDNLNEIQKVLKNNPADVYFLQETDLDSKRSYHINQKEFYEEGLDLNGYFAYNFKCNYVPYPLPTIGRVESGLLTLTDRKVSQAERISLPESFSWPVKTCNLKRCLLRTYFPLEGTDKQLVLINFHLEAYDSGEGKIAQTKMLSDILTEEYEKGNYVIAGGDFNQAFDFIDKYPLIQEDGWKPGLIQEKDLPEHFSFSVDDSYPTCRTLDSAYTGSYETSQVFVIDGFIVSDNLQVDDVHVINTDFVNTDHQPVQVQVSFK